MGVDQIIAGIRGLATGKNQHALLEQAVTHVTGSETAGALLPGALSLGFGIAGARMARYAAQTAATEQMLKGVLTNVDDLAKAVALAKVGKYDELATLLKGKGVAAAEADVLTGVLKGTGEGARGMGGAGEVTGSSRHVIPEGCQLKEFTYNGKAYQYVHDPRIIEGVAYTDARGIVHINPKLATSIELKKVFDHEIIHVWLTPNRYSKTITWRQLLNERSYNSIDTIRFIEETAAHTHEAYAMLRSAGHSRTSSSVRAFFQGLAETHGYRLIDGRRLVSYPNMMIELGVGGAVAYLTIRKANEFGNWLFPRN